MIVNKEIFPAQKFPKSKEKFYHRWCDMKKRCYNKNRKDYPRYGGRGIFICEEWLDYWNFHRWCESTFEEGKTLDRKNNNGPYSPDNCRWATAKEQRLNSEQTEARNRSNLESLKKSWANRDGLYGNVKTRAEKKCSRCSKRKFLLAFSKNKSMADGRSHYCFDCSRKVNNDSYKKRVFRNS